MITKEDLNKLAYSIDLSEDADIINNMANSLSEQNTTEIVRELLFVQSRLTDSLNLLTSNLNGLFEGVSNGDEVIILNKK